MLMKLTPGRKNSHVGKIFRVIFRQADSSNSSVVDVDLGGGFTKLLSQICKIFCNFKLLLLSSSLIENRFFMSYKVSNITL